ncbi:tetratricopeptide repeat protein [Planktotalea arctica]|uniref:tetratricopeptide repeat protein n=1 Tax=Planktotalea arctica TaxID=1481893 RepID=UPI00111C088A|nr:hypothetical protein [Planktotalea arctica]
MRVLLSGILLYVFTTLEICAQTVGVRTAEHENFTRIVLDVSELDSAQVSQSGKFLRVTVSGKRIDTLSHDFFKRISKNVISDFSILHAGDGFQITLNCECSFTTFKANATMIAIDIFDEKNSSIQEEELKGVISKRTSKGSQIFDRPEPTKEEKYAEISPTPTPKNSSHLRLLDALAKISGKLDLAPPIRKQLNLSKESDGQIIFRSLPMQKISNTQEIEGAANAVLLSCDAALGFNPANWPQYNDPRTILSSTRIALGDRADDFGANTARHLAKTYLSLAMGAEAISLLNGISEPLQKDRALIAIARVIDGDPASSLRSVIAPFAHCSDTVIWRLLGASELSAKDADWGNEALKQGREEFDRWPLAMKNTFSARIAESFLTIGSPETAAFSIRRVTPSTDDLSGEQGIVAAKIAQKTQDSEAAKAILEPILSKDKDQAPLAVIALADIASARKDVLDPAQKAALESYSAELKGTDLEVDLIRARISAEIQQENFAAAVELLMPYRNLARASQFELVLDELAEGLLNIDPDVNFLREVVSLPSHNFKEVAKPIQEQLKKRVTKLGFDDLADQLGRSIGEGEILGPRASLDIVDSEKTSHREPTTQLNPSTNQQASSVAAQENEEMTLDGPGTPLAPEKLQELAQLKPISKAVNESHNVLSEIADLKAELETLGF